jgi:copper transport protein
LLVALALGLAAAYLQPGPPAAEAHALLERAEPPVNAQLREPPSVLTLYFTEPLERRFSTARVVDQTGARVEEAVEFDEADDALMRVRLKTLSPGYVTVFWETVSAVDGHRISGSYPLTILNPDGSQPPGQAPGTSVSLEGEEVKPPRIVVKALLLIAGAVLTGGLAFRLFVTPGLPGDEGEQARATSDVRSVYVAGGAILVLLAAGFLELFLQANNIGAGIREAVDTRWGERWLLRNALLILPVLTLVIDRATSRPVDLRRSTAAAGLLGALGYLALTSSVSHSAAGAGALWAAGSDFVHLLAASVWIGMLAMLLLLMRWVGYALERGERYGVLATSLQRFSSIAVVSLALLLLTGTINSVIQLGHISDLVETGYGRALLIKLLLILPLLAVGGINAYIYRPRVVLLAEGAGTPRQRSEALPALEERLQRTITYELALAVGVLVVVAVLVQLTPTRGRIDSGASEGKFVQTKLTADVSATIVIDPNQPGVNTFEVYLTGGVDTIESVRLNFQRRGDTGSEARLLLDASNPPTFYVGRGPYLAQPGAWTVTVDLRRTRGSDTAIPFELRVPDIGGVQTQRRGGDLAAPVDFSPASVILIAGSGLLAIALILGSVRQPGLPAGYLGLLAAEAGTRLSALRLRPAWSLAALVVLGIGLGLLLGSHLHRPLSQEEASQSNPVPSSPESIERGRIIFSQSCVQCHGESGRGDGPLASTLPIPPANLYDHIPYHPDEFFFNVISNGLSGIMPAFGSAYSEEERWHILNYLRSQFGQPPATE